MIWMSSWKTPKTMTKARPTVTGLRSPSGASVSAAPSTASNAPTTIRTAPPSGAPRPKVSVLSRARRQGDENLAKRKDLHRQGKEREKAPSDASRNKTRRHEWPEFRRALARRDDGARAEPNCDQGSVAERDDVDDNPARIHQRQNADGRAIDGDDAEDEADAERPAKRRALRRIEARSARSTVAALMRVSSPCARPGCHRAGRSGP